MKYLLDTFTLLWTIFEEADTIPKKAKAVMEETGNELVFSAASAWEIAIKFFLGRLELQSHPDEWLPSVVLKMGLRQLSITQRHALALVHLPLHHKDPFDRLLICQAKLEGLTIITPDTIFRKYRVPVIWG